MNLPAIGFLLVAYSSSSMAFAAPSTTQACEHFSIDHFKTENSVPTVSLGQFNFGKANDVALDLERYKTIFWPDVSLAIFDNAESTEPNAVLSATLTCLADVVDRRSLEITILRCPKVGEKIQLDGGVSRFAITPKHTSASVGDETHEGKY
jgi:hypothetical protein